MGHEKLKWMKDCLVCVVENQLCNLEEVDTKELGEAIDMIKDLEEAIYYATVTEAMDNPEKEKMWEMKKGDHHQENGDSRMYYGYPMMYADGGSNPHGGLTHMGNNGGYGNSGSGGRSYYDEGMYRDEREGRSYNSRRMYMEAKETHKDKTIQLRELEKYMQELS